MLKDTGERLILNDNWNLKTKLEHLHRYSIVAEFLEGKDVLDAACGTGYGTNILSSKAKSVIGIDLSQDAIDFANECFKEDNLQYRQMSIAEMDFEEDSFDAVVSFETIEHVPEDIQRAFLCQVKRVLKPEGVLIISTPNDELERRVTFGEYTNKYHVCEFTENKFDEMLKQYFVNNKFYYQTVCSASTILAKGLEVGEGKIFGKDINADTERFYIAVCSDVDIQENIKLDSTMRPRIQDYYDEHYFSKYANIYLDTGNGFDGEAFVSAKCISYDGKKFNFRFELTGFEQVRAIRFDPMEHAGIVRITSCNSNDEQSIIVRPTNASYTSQGVDVFETVDPIYVVECESISKIDWIEIKGEILAQTPDYLVWNEREEQLSEANKKVNQLIQEREERENQLAEADRRITQLIEEKKELKAIKSHLQSLTEIEKKLEQNEEVLLNTQHTVNDILYVSQNAAWYKKTMKYIERRKITDILIDVSNGFYNGLYRLAKKSPRLYRGMQKVFLRVSKKSPKMRKRLEQHIRQAKEDVDQIKPIICDSDNRVINELEQCDMEMKQENPLVSVIVPNYNHAPYLRERLDSIYGQTYKNIEVILLDDCSKDDSRNILKEYAERYPDITICDFNDENVGRANLQWNKGLSRAKGKYIWIAESDDWCELDFLEKLVPKLEHQSVMIAFARSVFMTDGEKTWTTEEYLNDIDIQWDKPFSMTGFEAVQRGFAVKNIIPNASSAVFRNIGKIPDEVMDIWKNIRLCGDWIFYLYLVKGGAFYYTNETTNYYRIHKGSTSLSVQRTAEYYQESEIVSCYIARNFKVSAEVFNKTLKTLQAHYIDNGFGTDPEDIKQWYRLEEIQKASEKRMPNILICNFAMKMGGGEILPIHLANALRKLGAPVTFLDCRMEEYDEKVRNMLEPGVPLVELRTPLALQIVVKIFGSEIVHSHHGSVDKLVSELLENTDCNQVITLHGMYEAIDDRDCDDLLRHVTKTCKTFAYIADKNLVPFKERNYFKKCDFIKIGNGLVAGCPTAVQRSQLNIPENSFVLCLVSRARFDKGWIEAAEAVIKANDESSREIHLILVGDGEAYDTVKRIESPFIHAVGARENPRAYFAAADMGFLPSRFAGESFPLVVIESLMCGKPVLASNIGEIPNQITLENGNCAGILFELENGIIQISKLAHLIADIANDASKYKELVSHVPEAAKRFDICNIANDYITIYKRVIEGEHGR